MNTTETQDEKDRENKHQHEPGSDSAPSSVRDPLGPILDSNRSQRVVWGGQLARGGLAWTRKST